MLIAEVAALYLKPKHIVCDPTYGKGAFWNKIDLNKIKLLYSDLITVPERTYDFRHLPYPDHSFDHFILDPPYAHSPGNMKLEPWYQNASTKGLNHKAIIELYTAGLREAKRLLKPHGLVWVKCQDEIESGKQCWTHVELLAAAEKLAFTAQDFFVLMQQGKPIVQKKVQHHARKNHSYLWLFKQSKNCGS